MREARARQILGALVRGVDPMTGEEIPPGSVLQQVEVLRALLAARDVLDRSVARAQRRARRPTNVGQPWSDQEDHQLIRAFRSGEPIPELAADHRRTVRAIELRLASSASPGRATDVRKRDAVAAGRANTAVVFCPRVAADYFGLIA